MSKTQPKKEGVGGKPGPDEERLKIDGDWKEAMKKTLRTGKPIPNHEEENED